MSDPIIKVGSTGDAVVKAQRELMFRYYLPPGTDDGIFGPVTRHAVLQYQVDRTVGGYNAYTFPLDVDGIVGPQTWSRLAPPTIAEGAKGNPVLLLQEILKGFKFPPYDPGPLDADFGPLTKAAVEAFQSNAYDYNGNQLKVDGVVGPVTWRALFS